MTAYFVIGYLYLVGVLGLSHSEVTFGDEGDEDSKRWTFALLWPVMWLLAVIWNRWAGED